VITALLAAAHLYVLPWKLLFLLPVPSDKVCAVTSLRYGPPDRSWERGSNPQASQCEFHVAVKPGPLLPAWVEKGPTGGKLDVIYTLPGSEKPQVLTLEPQTITPVEVAGSNLSAKAAKAGRSARVEVTNRSRNPVLLGDAVAHSGKPKEGCVGTGPAAVLQPGETLVDQRPGPVYAKMEVWVAAFTGEKECRWVEVRR